MSSGHIVEKEKVHPEIWKNADKTFRRIPRDKIAAARHNRVSLRYIDYAYLLVIDYVRSDLQSHADLF